MRKALFVMLVLVGGVAAARGNDEAPWAEKLFDNKTDHDFGNVPHGTQMLHKFPFKNVYAVPLDVTITRISCNCTTAETSTQRVAPHGSGSIDVRMNGRVFINSRTVYVHVQFSNPQFYSTAALKVSANSRPDIVFNPGQVNFGVVPQGQGAAQDITVEYAGTFPWKVENQVVTNGLPVEAKVELLRTDPGIVGYKISVSLKADTPPGVLKGEMFLRTNDPASPLLPVLIEGNVQPALTVAPAAVRLRAAVNEARSASVVVRGNKPFRILSVDGGGEGLVVANALPDTPADTHRLTFRLKKEDPGDFRRKLQIKTDLQSAPVTVIVEGIVTP